MACTCSFVRFIGTSSIDYRASTPSQQRGVTRRSGKSVYQIAKAANVSQIVVSRFLSGERDIQMETADRLAVVLGLQLESR